MTVDQGCQDSDEVATYFVTIELTDSQTHGNHELVNISCSKPASLLLDAGNYSIRVRSESGLLVCSSELLLEQAVDEEYVEGEHFESEA